MTDNNRLMENKLVADDECPTNDFNQGVANGKCWGDGHYRCKYCVNYRSDFKRLGQDFIDFAHTSQSGLRFTPLV